MEIQEIHHTLRRYNGDTKYKNEIQGDTRRYK